MQAGPQTGRMGARRMATTFPRGAHWAHTPPLVSPHILERGADGPRPAQLGPLPPSNRRLGAVCFYPHSLFSGIRTSTSIK